MLEEHTRIAGNCSTVCVTHIVSYVDQHRDLSTCTLDLRTTIRRRHCTAGLRVAGLWVMTRTKDESASDRRASHFFMLVGLGASHSPHKLGDEESQTCTESSSEPPPYSEPASTSIVVVMGARVVAGTMDTADITAMLVVMAGVARTLDHVDLVVGPRCWPIGSTRRGSKSR
jgi:hypothetical protein